MSVEGIKFSYDSYPVLDDVTFTVQKGEILGIVGPNGSGKSTLLQVISRAVAPNAGRVMLNGQPAAKMPQRDLARQMAVVRQTETVAFDYQVIDVVFMGRLPYLGPFQSETAVDSRAVDTAMRAAGITHLAERHVLQLSGGEFQRVALARALAQDTPVLLLDEPTSNLDIKYQVQVLQLLRKLADQGRAIIVTLHDLNLASQYCHRLLVLHAGRIRASGNPEEVLQPALLKEVYGVDVLVTSHPVTKLPLVLPQYA